MDRFDLYNISETYMELLNPTSPEKIIRVGKFLRLHEGSRVIDFGTGFAEPLVLWAQEFGISGIGIDIRPRACERARKKIAARGLADRIEIVCGRGADYVFEERIFDAATCIGATFVFGGYRQTIQTMKRALKKGGRLGIGEAYWLSDRVPPAYAQRETSVLPESELLRMTREEGSDLEYVVRASHDDWDRYEADNWYGLIRWLEDNPGHPERGQVVERLRSSQDEYLQFAREYFGWALYVLAPAVDAVRRG